MRAAVLGAGRIGRVHSQQLASEPRVDSLVIADTDPLRAQALADELGPVARAATVDELFASRPDAIVIGAPTPVHGVLLERCVALGIPTLCEKPLAKTLEETIEMVNLVENGNAVVQVGLMRRFEPGNIRLRSMIEEEALGTVLFIRAASHDMEAPGREYAASSGGIFRDQLIHDFDAIRWVTQQEVRRIHATGSIRTLTYLEEFGDSEVAAVVLEMSDGVLAVVGATRQDGRGEDYRIEVVGTKDSAATGTNEHTPLLPLDATAHTLISKPYDGPTMRFSAAYAAQTAHFLSVAAGEDESRCSARAALASVLVSLAAERSALSGEFELVQSPSDVLGT